MIGLASNLEEFFIKQQRLDHFIIEKHEIKQDKQFRENKILALIDEICELMNKTRIHKFWSTKGMDAKDVLIEEYVDGWHFLLSIGNDIEAPTEHYGIDARRTFTEVFRTLLFTVNAVYEPMGWQSMTALYKGLGHMLKFTEQEVIDAYNRKYQINLDRQNNGY